MRASLFQTGMYICRSMQVNLKRKHWDKSGEDRAQQRCKEVFLRQVSRAPHVGALELTGLLTTNADTKLSLLQMSAAEEVSKARMVSSLSPGRQHTGKQPAGESKQARKAALKQAQKREVARMELAEAFREQRRMKLGGGKQAAASQASLVRLVNRGEGTA